MHCEPRPCYPFLLDRHFKIWFSARADRFMPAKVQFGAVRFRRRHPDVAVSLIYSRRCLGEAAEGQLREFCARLGFQAIELDADIAPLLVDEPDRRLLGHVREELEAFLEDGSGNLGAASDGVRMLVPVLEAFGVYTELDLDLPLATTDQAELGVPVAWPCYLARVPAPEVAPGYSYMAPVMLSSLVAAAVGDRGSRRLHPDAKDAIRRVQEHVLRNYQQRKWEALRETLWGIQPEVARPPLCEPFERLIAALPPDGTIQDFRRAIGKTADFPPAVCQRLLWMSVFWMTGPPVWLRTFTDPFSGYSGDQVGPYVLAGMDPPCFAPCRAFSEAVLPLFPEIARGPDPETGRDWKFASDLSWTPAGQAALWEQEAVWEERVARALRELD